MPQLFRERLTSGGVIILDGATGTMLESRGAPMKPSANLTHADDVLAVHRAYANAGADALLTNTLTANRLILALDRQDGDIENLNRKGVWWARVGAANRAFVLGNIGQTGAILDERGGELSPERCTETYVEQAKLLIEARVDGIMIETMSCLRQALLALAACKKAATDCERDVPVIVSFELFRPVDGGATMMGDRVSTIATELPQAGADAIGINCSSQLTPTEIANAVGILHRQSSLPIAVEMNAHVLDETGKSQRDIGAKEFVRHMQACRDAGAQILGGCCKTTPDYIRALARAPGIK